MSDYLSVLKPARSSWEEEVEYVTKGYFRDKERAQTIVNTWYTWGYAAGLKGKFPLYEMLFAYCLGYQDGLADRELCTDITQ